MCTKLLLCSEPSIDTMRANGFLFLNAFDKCCINSYAVTISIQVTAASDCIHTQEKKNLERTGQYLWRRIESIINFNGFKLRPQFSANDCVTWSYQHELMMFGPLAITSDKWHGIFISTRIDSNSTSFKPKKRHAWRSSDRISVISLKVHSCHFFYRAKRQTELKDKKKIRSNIACNIYIYIYCSQHSFSLYYYICRFWGVPFPYT